MGYCSVYPTPAGPSLTPGACETRSGKNVYLVYFATAELLGGSAVSRAIAGGAGGSGAGGKAALPPLIRGEKGNM